MDSLLAQWGDCSLKLGRSCFLHENVRASCLDPELMIEVTNFEGYRSGLLNLKVQIDPELGTRPSVRFSRRAQVKMRAV